jgi:DNA-binding LacI/PurR family transcriptional regulator
MNSELRTSRPTLLSLAGELGVSRQTISNVINNPEIVKQETRDRVLAAIASSGYRPSAVGRALRTQRSLSIALRLYPAVDGVNGAIMDRFVHSLAVAAQQQGYRITLFAADSADDEVEVIDALHRASSIDVAILTDTHTGDARPAGLLAAGVPFVAFGRPWGERGDSHCWVDVDGSAGTEAAARSLRADGHARIGYLGWPAGSGVGDDRRAGWARAVSDLPGSAALDLGVVDGARPGAEAAAELLARGATSLVCASDSLALGALTVFRGLRKDGRLPLVGFDDTPVARALGMSSVHQPVELAAERLIGMVADLLDGRTPPEPQQLLTPELVLRDLATFAQ